MDKERLNLRLTKNQADFIGKYMIKNNHRDRQDAIREIINMEIKKEKSFLYKLKNLF